MASKRASIMPTAAKGPKPPISFAPGIVVADSASLIGTHPMSIRENTVIHPRAKLRTLAGPLMIGTGCIISERCVVGIDAAPASEDEPLHVIEIGNGVVMEVGALVEARQVGDGCVIDVHAKIGRGAVVGKHCKIGPKCVVAENEVLPDHTVIYGSGLRRIDTSDVDHLKMKMVAKQIEVLRKLIPSNPQKHQ